MMQDKRNSDNQWVAGVMIGMFLGIGVLILFTWLMREHPVIKEKTTIQVMYDLNDPYTQQKVSDYLNELHVKYPKIALAQMKLESANGTANIFREGNNLFGMKLAIKRPTTALGEKNGHAYYSHWRQSCVDYALYQAFVSNTENLESESSWLDFVGRVYAKDDSYRKKLLVIRRSLDNK